MIKLGTGVKAEVNYLIKEAVKGVGLFIQKNTNSHIVWSNLNINKKMDYFFDYSKRFEIDLNTFRNIHNLFKNENPLNVEIGFGNGEFLLYQARKERNKNFIGFELESKNFSLIKRKLYDLDLNNVKIMRCNGTFAMDALFHDESIENIFLCFPSPWFKKKNIKHAVANEDFVDLISHKLMRGGSFELVTDDYLYLAYSIELLKQSGFFQKGEVNINPRREIATYFERRWKRKGRTIYGIKYFKTKVQNKKKKPLYKKIDFPIATNMPHKCLIKKEKAILRILDVYSSLYSSDIFVEAIVGEIKYPQHIYFHLKRGKTHFFLYPFTSLIPTEGVENSLKRLI
jgi:tRNA (guanine-N7-)-methyltransferase